MYGSFVTRKANNLKRCKEKRGKTEKRGKGKG